MEERRHYLRIGKWAAISYAVSRSSLKSGSLSSNISEGGICFPTIGRLNPGTVLDMEIRLEENQAPVRVVAEVVWSKPRDDSRYPFEAGLIFVDTGEPFKNKVRKFVEEFLNK